MRSRSSFKWMAILLAFALACATPASSLPTRAAGPWNVAPSGTVNGSVPQGPELPPDESRWQPPSPAAGNRLPTSATEGSRLLPQAVPLDWVWQNPLPTGNNLWDVYCVDATTCFAVGDDGTIVRTTDGGERWENLNSGTHWYLLHVHCVNVDTCWAAGGGGTILKTVDGGSSWVKQRSGTSLYLKGMDFVSESTGWVVGANEIILKTTDGGASWVVQHGPGYALLWAVDFVDGNTGLAVGWEYPCFHPLLLRTTDGGTTWAAIGSGYYCPTNVFCWDADTCWTVSGNGLIHKTTNGGDTWTRQFLANNELWGLYFADANTGWVSGGGAGGIVLKTTDGGATWVYQGSPDDGGLFALHFADASTGWRVGDTGAILKTVDGGATWTRTTAVTLSDVNKVDCVDASTCWVVDNSGRLLRTVDGGATWSILRTNLPRSPDVIDFVDADNGWGLVQGNVVDVVKTTNGGAFWTEVFSAGYLNDLHFVNTEVGWVVGGVDHPAIGQIVLKTSDGGLSWTRQTTGSGVSLGHASFIDSRTGWVGGGNVILRTTDGGVSWVDVSPDTEFAIDAFEFADSESGWAVTNRAGAVILSTRDGGASWQQTLHTPYPIFDMRFVDRDTGWVVTGREGWSSIVKTTDGGVTWYAQRSGATKRLFGIDCVSSQLCWAVGEQGTILHTSSGGGEGTRIYPPFRAYLPAIQASP